MSVEKTLRDESVVATHKAIREALEADEYLTAQVAKADLRALLADLDAKTAEVERLQALRPVAMTPSEVTEAFDSELRSSYTDFEAGIRTAEIHHHITQKEQG